MLVLKNLVKEYKKGDKSTRILDQIMLGDSRVLKERDAMKLQQFYS